MKIKRVQEAELPKQAIFVALPNICAGDPLPFTFLPRRSPLAGGGQTAPSLPYDVLQTWAASMSSLYSICAIGSYLIASSHDS